MEPYIIFSHGRCGTTLLADLIGAMLYSKEQNIRYTKDSRLPNNIAKFPADTVVKRFDRRKYVFNDDDVSPGEELKKHKVIHTHQLDHRYKELKKTSTIFFCSRRDLVETISSLMIAEHLDVYNHFEYSKDHGRDKWSNIPIEKLVISADRVQSIIRVSYRLLELYKNCKQQNSNAHLLFYEDWIYNLKNLPIELVYNHDLNRSLCKKVPVDKKEWVDYQQLQLQVLKFNNGSTQLKMK